MVFPYCVGDSGQPKPEAGDLKFQWLKERIGADNETLFILDELKEVDDGMVYGTRLRELHPLRQKGTSGRLLKLVPRLSQTTQCFQSAYTRLCPNRIPMQGLEQALFPSPFKTGIGNVDVASQDLKKAFLYELETCQERLGMPASDGMASYEGPPVGD